MAVTHQFDYEAALVIADASDDYPETSLASAERKTMLKTHQSSFRNAYVARCGNGFRIFVTHAVGNCSLTDVCGRGPEHTFEGRTYVRVDQLSGMRGSNTRKILRSMHPVELAGRLFGVQPWPTSSASPM
jgi:hypothetical protein